MHFSSTFLLKSETMYCKKMLLCCLLLMAMAQSSLMAQQTNKHKTILNHIAVYVHDLQQSTAFYQQVIGLDTIPEPFHDGRHTWLTSAATVHLHLIQGAEAGIAHDKNTHLCFTVASVEIFIRMFRQKNIAFEDWPGDQNTFTTGWMG